MRCLLLWCLFCAPAHAAELRWLTLGDIGGEALRALYTEAVAPDAPVVIFNHGTGIRRDGYEIGDRGNMDVAGYVDAFARAGYTTYAPLRRFLHDEATKWRRHKLGSTAQWQQVIDLGVAAVQAAMSHARKKSPAPQIALVGFSEGALVSLWAAIEHAGVDALVIMSPASLREAKQQSLKSAAVQASNLTMPVMVTLAEDDPRPIRKISSKLLLPNLQRAEIPVVFKASYSGGHASFHQVRGEHMTDVIRFLNQYTR